MKNLNRIYNGRLYKFNQYLGIVRSYKNNNSWLKKEIYLNEKEKKALDIIDNPFLIKKNPLIKIQKSNENHFKLGKYYIKLLIWSYHNCYPLLRLLMCLNLNKFDSSQEAINYFCKIHPKYQNLLCLPRCVFAKTTSKQFTKEGILIIGMFHPSRRMHAWIIENGCNPYIDDTIWINFTPVAIFS